jgi:hypothetical protein
VWLGVLATLCVSHEGARLDSQFFSTVELPLATTVTHDLIEALGPADSFVAIFTFVAECAPDRGQSYSIAARGLLREQAGQAPDLSTFEIIVYDRNRIEVAKTSTPGVGGHQDTVRMVGWVCRHSGPYYIRTLDTTAQYGGVDIRLDLYTASTQNVPVPLLQQGHRPSGTPILEVAGVRGEEELNLAYQQDFAYMTEGGFTGGEASGKVFRVDGFGCNSDDFVGLHGGMIALIEPGPPHQACDFYDRCLLSQQAGAIGCLLYSSDERGILIGGLGGAGSNIVIPAFGLSRSAGVEVAAAAQEARVLRIYAAPETSCAGGGGTTDCGPWQPWIHEWSKGWGIASGAYPVKFTFHAKSGVSYYLLVEGGHGLSDSVLELYNSDQVLVGHTNDVTFTGSTFIDPDSYSYLGNGAITDHDLIITRHASIIWPCTKTGTYTASVTGYVEYSGHMFEYHGGFFFQVFREPGADREVEPGDAPVIELHRVPQGCKEEANGVDPCLISSLPYPVAIAETENFQLFAVQFRAGKSYIITAEVPEATDDVLLVLLDSEMNTLAINDEAIDAQYEPIDAQSDSIICFKCGTAGYYYIRIDPKRLTTKRQAASCVILVKQAEQLDDGARYVPGILKPEVLQNTYSFSVVQGFYYSVYTELAVRHADSRRGAVPLLDSELVILAGVDGLAALGNPQAPVMYKNDDIVQYTQKQSFIQWKSRVNMTVFVLVKGHRQDQPGHYILHVERQKTALCTEDHNYCANEVLESDCASDELLQSDCPISCGVCQPSFVVAPPTPTPAYTSHGCVCRPTSVDNDGLSFSGCSIERGGWCNVEFDSENAQFDLAPKSHSHPIRGCDAREASTKPGGHGSMFGWDHCAPQAQTCEDISLGSNNLCPDLLHRGFMCDQTMRSVARAVGLSISAFSNTDILSFFCPKACDACICETTNDDICDEGKTCPYTTDAADCFCRYENDGVCDAGSRCPPDTDIVDCRCDYVSDGTCNEGWNNDYTMVCPYGSDSADCCSTTLDGVCDERQHCPRGSDRIDCFCPSSNDGVCDESEGQCPLFSDLGDCERSLNVDPACPNIWANDGICDEGTFCAEGTDAADCNDCCHGRPSGTDGCKDCSPAAFACTEHSDCQTDMYCAYSFSPYASWCHPCASENGETCFDGPASVSDGCARCYRKEMCDCHQHGGTVWHFHAFDSYGDGWNGMTFNISIADADASGSKPLRIGSPLKPQLGNRLTHEYEYPVCVYDVHQCYIVDVAGVESNTHASEVTWELLNGYAGQAELLGDRAWCRAHGALPWHGSTEHGLTEHSRGPTIASGGAGRFTAAANGACQGVRVCEPGLHNVIVTIRPDTYPEETAWSLVSQTVNNENDTWLSLRLSLCKEGGLQGVGGKACAKIPSSELITYSVCVVEGTYRFAVFDSFSDGMCCMEGFGGYDVAVDGKPIAGGGAFGSVETVVFLVSAEGAEKLEEMCWGDQSASFVNITGTGRNYPDDPTLDGDHCTNHDDCAAGYYCDMTSQCWGCGSIYSSHSTSWCDTFECSHGQPLDFYATRFQVGATTSNAYYAAANTCGLCCVSPDFLKHCPPHTFPEIKKTCIEADVDCAASCATMARNDANGLCDEAFNCKSLAYDNGDCLRDWDFSFFSRGIAFVYAGEPMFVMMDDGRSWGSRESAFFVGIGEEWTFDPCHEDMQTLGANWTVCNTRAGHLAFEFLGIQQLYIDLAGRAWDRANGLLMSSKQHSMDTYKPVASELTVIMQVGPWSLATFNGYLAWFWHDKSQTRRVDAEEQKAMMVITRRGEVWSRGANGFLTSNASSRVSFSSFYHTSSAIRAEAKVLITSSGAYSVWANGEELGGGRDDTKTLAFSGDCTRPLLIAVAAEACGECGIDNLMRMQIKWCDMIVASSPSWICTAAYQNGSSWSSEYDTFNDESWTAAIARENPWTADDGLSSRYDRAISSSASSIWATQSTLCTAKCQPSSRLYCRIKIDAQNAVSERPTGAQSGVLNTIIADFSGMSSVMKLTIAISLVIVFAFMAVRLRKHLQRKRSLAPVTGMELSTRLFAGDDSATGVNVLQEMFQSSAADELQNSVMHGTGDRPLIVGDRVGDGAFGAVYKAQWGDRTVAVKQLKLTKREMSNVQKVLHEFKAEVMIMSKLDHPHVITMHGFTTQPKICIIMEYMSNGDLGTFLHSRGAELNLELRLNIALDAANGMEYLHSLSPPIIHRDFKSPNLLLDAKMRVKITDFGLAKVKATTAGRTQIMTTCGTPYWTAPEILLGKLYNESVDLYSYGMVLWELWTCETPFSGMPAMECAVQVASGEEFNRWLDWLSCWCCLAVFVLPRYALT